MKSTNEYLQELSGSIGIPIDRLIEVNESDGLNEDLGTWGHRRVAIRFAQWCSTSFAVQVDAWVEELMTAGSVSISTSSATALPPHKEAVEVAHSIADIHETLGDIDPRLAQILIDRAMQTVMPLPLLTGAAAPKLSGAVEMAENLGFSVGKEQSSLGRAIAKAWRDAYGSDPQETKRECGGAMRKLKVYPSDDPIVIATIKEFYSDREVA